MSGLTGIRMVDPHSHHQFSNYSTLVMLREASYVAAACLAYIPVRPSSASTLRDLFEWLVEEERARFERVGIRAVIGVGIHPRNIPRAGRSDALSYVEEYLSSADVLGEVGLETGSDVEREILARQLDVAEKLDRPVIVHTPRSGKTEVLRMALKVLQESRLQPERVLIDHLTPNLIREIPRGYYLGLTVQPGKLTEEQVAEALRSARDRRLFMVVNSDAGREDSDPLAVMKVAHHLASLGISLDEIEDLVSGNARRFLDA